MSEREGLLPVEGELLDDQIELTFVELCRACRLPAERIETFVAEGIIEPHGRERRTWRFSGVTVRRVHTALRLERDLGINAAGAALALELMDEIERLRERLRGLES